jgi:hypothetical protein
MFIHLTKKSRNTKTGSMPVTTSDRTTCPASCPFKKNGCYAENFHLRLFWDKVTKGIAGGTWTEFIEQVKAIKPNELWRHNQAGDLPHNNERIDMRKMRQLMKASDGKRGFTYSHHDMTIKHNREAIRKINASDFTVNLSANNARHADDLADLDIGPVVVVLPQDQKENSKTPANRTIVVCPQVTRENLSCKDCGLCYVKKSRAIVGFPAHGASKKKANQIACA